MSQLCESQTGTSLLWSETSSKPKWRLLSSLTDVAAFSERPSPTCIAIDRAVPSSARACNSDSCTVRSRFRVANCWFAALNSWFDLASSWLVVVSRRTSSISVWFDVISSRLTVVSPWLTVVNSRCAVLSSLLAVVSSWISFVSWAACCWKMVFSSANSRFDLCRWAIYENQQRLWIFVWKSNRATYSHENLQSVCNSVVTTLCTFTCTHYNTHALAHYTQTVLTTFVLSNFILILSYTYNFHTRWYLRTHFPPPSDWQLQCQRQLHSCLSPRGNSILFH